MLFFTNVVHINKVDNETWTREEYFMVLGLPWWIYVVIAFMFFSGYMAFRAMRAEKMLEQQFIEREGEIYMHRMEEERKRKQQSSG